MSILVSRFCRKRVLLLPNLIHVYCCPFSLRTLYLILIYTSLRAYILSGPQYNILRNGGTERPNSSILEAEERPGTYACAACQTPLFTSQAKFHSGTGWPSFASTIGNNVEIEQVNPLQANLVGAELRCASCGGHLGDVFNDGLLFVNTPAFVTGKRYCIDGAALIFTPEKMGDGGGDVEVVYGDTPPPSNKRDALPGFLQPPTITPR